MYSEYKVYGPYKRKDKREIVILVKGKDKQTISYPKYLMEISLGRKLLPTEDVHHIDGNVSNNTFSNLEVVNSSSHRSEHSRKYLDDIEVNCGFCNKSFMVTPLQQRNKVAELSRKGKKATNKFFCSKTCSGKYGRSIQMGTFV